MLANSVGTRDETAANFAFVAQKDRAPVKRNGVITERLRMHRMALVGSVGKRVIQVCILGIGSSPIESTLCPHSVVVARHPLKVLARVQVPLGVLTALLWVPTASRKLE